MSIDPAKPCEHETFHTDVGVHRLTNCRMPTGGPVTGYTADITVRCVECGERFRWLGLDQGVHPGHPTVSVNGLEMRAPLCPESAPDDFGQELPAVGLHFMGWHGPNNG